MVPEICFVGAAATIRIDLAIPNFGLQEWSGIKSYEFLQQGRGGGGNQEEALYEVFAGMPEYQKDGSLQTP